jgi:integrase
MKTKLTPGFVMRAPLPAAGKSQEIFWDSSLPGFGFVVTEAGHKSYVVQYRHAGRSHRMSLKGVLGLNAAKKEALKLLADVARGRDPLAERQKANRAAADTFAAIAAEYIRREAGNVRNMRRREQVLRRLVYPSIGSRPIADIRRSDLVRLLDRIEDDHGAAAAQQCLAFVSRIMSWYTARHDEFRSPIVRGMSRVKQSSARQRTLSDDEIRAIWKAKEGRTDLFGAYVRTLLLTACRRNEVASMAFDELAGNTWSIPANRTKQKVEHVVPLSGAAVAVLDSVPRIAGSKYVFSSDGVHALSGFSARKEKLDKASGVTGWTLHDLRRTARSLLSRAGVDSDISERCLGHIMPAMRRTYDRHSYMQEKKQAFEALAGMIERILNPVDNFLLAAYSDSPKAHRSGTPHENA